MIAAEDREDMNLWLDIIHRCMEEDTSTPRYNYLKTFIKSKSSIFLVENQSAMLNSIVKTNFGI